LKVTGVRVRPASSGREGEGGPRADCARPAPWARDERLFLPPRPGPPRLSPLVVAFAGIDGAGKSTQASLFCGWLSRTYCVCAVSTKLAGPGDWVLKRLAERMFGDQHAYHPAIPPEVRAVGCAIDAAAHLFDTVRANLVEGRIVVCDRYRYCEEAYFRAYGTDMTWPDRILSLVPSADVCFLLDVTPDIAYRRLLARREPPNLQERPEVLERVRREYLALECSRSEMILVDASGAPEQVQAEIRSRFESFARERARGEGRDRDEGAGIQG